MTLKQLEAFYLAATLGSFALAAQRVHVTQSSLSKRIAELEAWAGAELFDRSGQKAKLTEAGQRLMPDAVRMLELRETMRGNLSGSSALVGRCRFGISELGALTWLPSFVARMRREHPNLVLQPLVDLSRRLEQQVLRGELDFAVIPGPPETVELASHQVDDVRFSWMAAPERAIPSRLLTVDELARHPLITMSQGSGMTQAFDAWAAQQDLRMERIVASNSLMAVIGLTMADIGLSFLPRAFLRLWVDRGLLVAIDSDPPLPSLPYCFMHRVDDHRTMLSTLLSHVRELAQYVKPVVIKSQNE
jgi:DNA-binding transcriptional LysR family regulator